MECNENEIVGKLIELISNCGIVTNIEIEKRTPLQSERRFYVNPSNTFIRTPSGLSNRLVWCYRQVLKFL